MAIYTEGKSVATTGLPVVAPKDVKAGKEYIWEYWTPAITFSVISPETLTGFIKGLLRLKDTMRNLSPEVQGDPPLEITGVTVDTSTGRIWIRGKPVAVPTATDDPQVLQAGVNPMAIFALIGLVFGLIGAAVSLRFVYELTGGGQKTGGPPALDPCNNPGIGNYVTCLARKSSWFAFGALFGVVVLMGYLIVKFGKVPQ